MGWAAGGGESAKSSPPSGSGGFQGHSFARGGASCAPTRGNGSCAAWFGPLVSCEESPAAAPGHPGGFLQAGLSQTLEQQSPGPKAAVQEMGGQVPCSRVALGEAAAEVGSAGRLEGGPSAAPSAKRPASLPLLAARHPSRRSEQSHRLLASGPRLGRGWGSCFLTWRLAAASLALGAGGSLGSLSLRG